VRRHVSNDGDAREAAGLIGSGRLERSHDCIIGAAPRAGVELLRAWFAGRAYARHRHDTYAICLTDQGVQAFDYRGATRRSGPGDVVVLHPDEVHDGRAGSDAGFGYRIIYVAPERIADAARTLCGRSVPLPFVGEPVVKSATLAEALATVFDAFPAAQDPLAVDALIDALARGLLELDRSSSRRRPSPCDMAALERTRQFLLAHRRHVVTSEQLESVSGHDRFTLARHFRRAYGTSPYRYLLMRRLDDVRRQIAAGPALAAIAVDCGFADQAHLTRMFKAAYGLTPAQFRRMVVPLGQAAASPQDQDDGRGEAQAHADIERARRARAAQQMLHRRAEQQPGEPAWQRGQREQRRKPR
jgi:AraC-like DNA-binding protein